MSATRSSPIITIAIVLIAMMLNAGGAFARRGCTLALPPRSASPSPACQLINDAQRINLTAKVDSLLRDIGVKMYEIVTVANCHEEYRTLNEVSIDSYLAIYSCI